jgi:aldehyde dehydrogenase
VLDDVDLSEDTVRRMVKGAFSATGQVCFGVKRIYVPGGLHDRFVEAFQAAVDEIVVGPGDDPRSTMGPLNNAEQLRIVEKMLADAAAGNAVVTTLGRRLDSAAWQHRHRRRSPARGGRAGAVWPDRADPAVRQRRRSH